MKKIFILSLFVVLMATACTPKSGDKAKVISLDEAKTEAGGFINDYLMSPGQKVSIKEVVDDGSLYKVVVKMADGPNGKSGEEVDSYISKDGKTFFPSAMDIDEFKAKKDGTTGDKQAAAPEVDLSNISKTDKPKVELFVMSHCPFGTQMEKGLLPVLDTLGDSVDFELKFCDYSMHGKKELDEEISQYCLEKNHPEKVTKYLHCFLADETKGDACLAEVGVNKAKHASCVAATDKEYKITEQYKDKSTWKSGRFPVFPIYAADNQKYGITGSPGLVINGNKIQSARDSASLLKTVCAGFKNEPESCQTSLSAVSPGAGFGFDSTKGAGADANCGG